MGWGGEYVPQPRRGCEISILNITGMVVGMGEKNLTGMGMGTAFPVSIHLCQTQGRTDPSKLAYKERCPCIYVLYKLKVVRQMLDYVNTLS